MKGFLHMCAKRGRRSGPAPTKSLSAKKKEESKTAYSRKSHKLRYRYSLGPNPTEEELQRDEEARVREAITDATVLAVDTDGTTLKTVGNAADGNFMGTFFDGDGTLKSRHFNTTSGLDGAIEAWLRHKEDISRQSSQGSSLNSSPSDVSGASSRISASPEAGVDEASTASVQKTLQIGTKDGPVNIVLPDREAPDVSDHVSGRSYSQDVVDYARELWMLNNYPQSRVLAKMLEAVTKVSIPPRTVDKWVDDYLATFYEDVGGGDVEEFAEVIGWDKDLVRKRLSLPVESQDVAERTTAVSIVANSQRELPAERDDGHMLGGELLVSDDAAQGTLPGMETVTVQGLEPEPLGPPSCSSLDDACVVMSRGHEPLFFKTHERARQFVKDANDALAVFGHDERFEVKEIEWRD